MSKTFATQRRLLSDIVSTDTDQKEHYGSKILPYKSKKPTANEQKFRKIVIKNKPFKGCAGSANVEMGNTRVSCVVTGPKEQQSRESPLEGVLNVSLHGCIDPAIRYSLEHALQAVVCLRKLARTEVDVELNVLSDDGGAMAACLIAAGIAISSANIEMFDIVLSCNLLIPTKFTGSQENSLVLDPDNATISEHAGKAATLTLAIMPFIGQVISMEFGGSPLSAHTIRNVMPMAFDYCLSLYPIVRQAVLENIED